MSHRLGVFECPACHCQVQLGSSEHPTSHLTAPAAESRLYARLTRDVEPAEQPEPPGMKRLHREKLVCFLCLQVEATLRRRVPAAT